MPAGNAPRALGRPRFRCVFHFDVLRRNCNTSPAHLIPLLLAAVTEFASGVKQADDLTAVVIKRVFQAAGGPETTPL